MARMVRTNVVIDQDLVAKVMSTFGLGSKRAAVDFALHAVLSEGRTGSATDPCRAALELKGTWADRSEAELRAVFGDEFPDSDEELGRA